MWRPHDGKSGNNTRILNHTLGGRMWLEAGIQGTGRRMWGIGRPFSPLARYDGVVEARGGWCEDATRG
jgi:hypothetical protein